MSVALAVMGSLGLAGSASAQGPPDQPPKGANDFACKPTAKRPYPVILVHGTIGDMNNNWITFSPMLKDQGFCVFALNYGGGRGLGPVADSAKEVEAFARRVLAATGAKKVSLLGHSQGGMLARYVVKLGGLANVTDDVIGLAPSNHGTDTPLAPLVGILGCAACADQAAGSPVYQALNAGDETPPPVSYTVVETRYDEIVTPYTSAFLAGDPSEVTNVLLQDRCPGDHVEHVTIAIPGDKVAFQWALDALERPGPANPRFQPDCSGSTLGHDPDPVAAGRAGGPSKSLAFSGGKIIFRGGADPRVPVSCSGATGESCRATVRLTRRAKLLGRGRANIGAGQTRTVPVALNRAGRRMLRRGRWVTVTARASASGARSVSRSFRFRRVSR